MFTTLEELTTAIAGVGPSQIFDDHPEVPDCGPYLTLTDYYSLAAAGALGIDEACYWITVGDDGHLTETPIVQPGNPIPGAICVAYYAA